MNKMVNGVVVPLTQEEIAQRELEEMEAAKPKPKSLMEQLDEIISQLDEETQLEFGPVIAQGKMYIESGKLQLLEKLIRKVETSRPEFSPVTQAMLEKL